jgi:uncharacterized membrane protein YeaQ/YmgE (transglycosylase-associated protein family)
MGVIAWIVLGAVAGFIAEHLTGRRTSFLLATVIGIVGALLGGFIAKEVFGAGGLVSVRRDVCSPAGRSRGLARAGGRC